MTLGSSESNNLVAADGKEWEQFFWVRALEYHLDPRISDLIYWPGEYFADGDNSRELSPPDILDTARKSKLNSGIRQNS